MNAYDIIRRPVITEQSMEAVADKKYVFMVDVNANKGQIKEAVELLSWHSASRSLRSTPSVCRVRSSAPALTPLASVPTTRRQLSL